MNDFGTVFGILVGAPAIAFAAVAASRHELSAYARRALVVYVSLLTVAFGSLVAGSLGNPAIVFIALAFGYFSNISDGPFALGLSAFGLVVLLVLGMAQTLPFSPLGPGLGLVGCLLGLIVEVKRSNYRSPPKH